MHVVLAGLNSTDSVDEPTVFDLGARPTARYRLWLHSRHPSTHAPHAEASEAPKPSSVSPHTQHGLEWCQKPAFAIPRSVRGANESSASPRQAPTDSPHIIGPAQYSSRRVAVSTRGLLQYGFPSSPPRWPCTPLRLPSFSCSHSSTRQPPQLRPPSLTLPRTALPASEASPEVAHV